VRIPAIDELAAVSIPLKMERIASNAKNIAARYVIV